MGRRHESNRLAPCSQIIVTHSSNSIFNHLWSTVDPNCKDSLFLPHAQFCIGNLLCSTPADVPHVLCSNLHCLNIRMYIRSQLISYIPSRNCITSQQSMSPNTPGPENQLWAPMSVIPSLMSESGGGWGWLRQVKHGSNKVDNGWRHLYVLNFDKPTVFFFFFAR